MPRLAPPAAHNTVSFRQCMCNQIQGFGTRANIAWRPTDPSWQPIPHCWYFAHAPGKFHQKNLPAMTLKDERLAASEQHLTLKMICVENDRQKRPIRTGGVRRWRGGVVEWIAGDDVRDIASTKLHRRLTQPPGFLRQIFGGEKTKCVRTKSICNWNSSSSRQRYHCK